jgi:hypothetical protein
MNPRFDDVLSRLRGAQGSLVAPVQLTVHAEDALVLWGYGVLDYEPPRREEQPHVHDMGGFRPLPGAQVFGADRFVFEGERLVTAQIGGQIAFKVLNNRAYDTTRQGSSPAGQAPIPGVPIPLLDYQTFLVTDPNPEYWTVRVGWAADNGARTILVEASRTVPGTILTTRVEVSEQGVFLVGSGASLFGPPATAIWTLSFQDPIPRTLAPGQLV